MTEGASKATARRKSIGSLNVRWGQLFFGLICLFFSVLLLRNSELAIGYLSDGLILCAKTLIPSLFPFLVLSELIVASGLIRPVGRLLSRPVQYLFGIRGEGAGAILLGFLCGFPLGTKTAVALYRQGELSGEELCHLLTFCNVPSAAFLINAVGISLFHCRQLGWELYIITLLSALLIGGFGKHFRKDPSTNQSSPISHAPIPRKPALVALTGAVSSSALAMLSICAFVLFFSTVVGILTPILSPLLPTAELSALCFGIFELTGGVSHAATCSPTTAPYLCAFLSGWSGLSVHFQVLSLCDGISVSFRPYFFAKLLHGGLNVLLLWAYFSIKAWVI